jgi:hypothetical protein
VARRKRPVEQVTVGGFVWFAHPPLSDPARERWMVSVPGIHVCVSDYGQDDPREAYFKGWRVVCGAPLKDEYPDRDAAMLAARDTIKNEVLHCMAYAREAVELKRSFASKLVERTRAAMRVCEAAGLELTSD